MPNQKVLEEKQAIVAALVEQMKNAAAGVLVDYKGTNVADDTKLRKELREAGVDYAVVKNTLLRFAVNQIEGFEAVNEHLEGTTALATCADDPIAPARVLCNFAKTHPNFTVKIGFMEGKLVDAAEVQALADLPSKETLIAQVLYGFNTPITKLAIALHAIAEKKAAEETGE